MSNAKTGIGSVLRRWNDAVSPGAYEEIVEVTHLAWDGPTREVIEVFLLNQSSQYTNKLQGILNANSVTATILFTRAQYIKLKTDLETMGNRDYQIIMPDGEGLEWTGFITEIPMDIGSSDVMQGDVVFEIDGKADFVSVATS